MGERRFQKVKNEQLSWFISLRSQITEGRVLVDQGQNIRHCVSVFKSYLIQFYPDGRGGFRVFDTPAVPGSVLSKADLPQTEDERTYVAQFPFASLVGYLLYFANSLRCDVHRAVLNLAAFMSAFGLVHWKA